MTNRHLARSIVLQTLFEWDFNSSGPFGKNSKSASFDVVDKEKKSQNSFLTKELVDSLKRNIHEFAKNLENDQFVSYLMELVLKKRLVVDEIIEKAATGWPINNISVINRNILRIGLTELLFGDRKEVPPKVAINEAIELAKTFGGDTSSKFINGVLGSVYKEIGEPGKEQKSKRKVNELLNTDQLPVEKFGGALVYTIKEKNIFLALVHDVFGYWTFSKGHLDTGESEETQVQKRIKEEIGLDIDIIERLGGSKYVASHPEKGKILKEVVYFLAYSKMNDLKLKESGGLDDAKWFKLSELQNIKIYNDILPLITKAIEIITNKQ